MRSTRLPVRIAALAAVSIFVASCGGSDDTSSSGGQGTSNDPPPVTDVDNGGPADAGTDDTAGSAAPVAGGSIVVGRSGSIVGWMADNCYTAATNQTLPMVYGTLLDWTPDGQGLTPGLAESVLYDADALTYTITLRDGLLFSDGSDLTSADVVFSVDQWKNGPVNGGFFANIVSAEASDDLTTVLTLSVPDTYVENLLSWCVTAVYPEDFGGRTADEFALAPIGAGPYELADWKNPGPSEEIVLERNTNYWQAGLPYLDGITYRSNVDPNQNVLAYNSGDLDMLELVDVETLGQLPEEEVVLGPNMAIELLLVNTKASPLDDVKVRQAIGSAIDRESLMLLYDGLAETAPGILPNNVPFSGDPTKPFRYDLEAAKALMAESSIPDGASLELLTDAGGATLGQVIADQLGEIGLDITIAVVDNGTLFSRAASGDYDLQINGNVATSPTALDPIVATQVIDWYFTGMSADLAADDIAAALATEDDAERTDLVSSIQDQLVAEAGNIGLVTVDSIYAVKPYVKGFSPFPYIRWYPQSVSVSD